MFVTFTSQKYEQRLDQNRTRGNRALDIQRSMEVPQLDRPFGSGKPRGAKSRNRGQDICL